MASPYRRIGAQADADLEAVKTRLRWLNLLLLLLLLLLIGTVIGYTVWCAILTVNSNGQQGTIAVLTTNLSNTQNNILQMIIEYHGNVTVLQTGNVSWTLSDVYPRGANAACATPSQYINQGPGGVGSLIAGTYELQNVQVGPLNYTMLVLNPPAEELTYTYASDVGSVVTLCLVNFTPTINFYDTIVDTAGSQATVYEFTASNLARITASPNCLASGACTIIPYGQEWYTGEGAYAVLQATPYPNAGQFVVQWAYSLNPGSFTFGSNFTISQPLQLILPSA